jgi:hypothetical protein
MTALTIFWIWMGLGLYLNIGYAYARYITNHDSTHSWFRRFLAGGWNIFEDKLNEDNLAPLTIFWILFFALSLVLWIVWLAYFICGGWVREWKG